MYKSQFDYDNATPPDDDEDLTHEERDEIQEQQDDFKIAQWENRYDDF